MYIKPSLKIYGNIYEITKQRQGVNCGKSGSWCDGHNGSYTKARGWSGSGCHGGSGGHGRPGRR